jgi:hypothetical protein
MTCKPCFDGAPRPKWTQPCPYPDCPGRLALTGPHDRADAWLGFAPHHAGPAS